MVASEAPIPIIAEAFATRMDKLATIDEMFKADSVFIMEVNKTGAELLGNPWDLPVALVGHDISLHVENIGDNSRRFLAALMGETIHDY
jgi:hypothetical protein